MKRDHQSRDSGQLYLTIYDPVPRGDGSFLLRPQKPQQRVTVAEAAKVLGCSVNGVYRLISCGRLAIERPTPHKTLVMVASLEAHRRASSDPEAWEHPQTSQLSWAAVDAAPSRE